MSIFSAALLLFLIMDPFGNIPMFQSLLRDYEPKRRKRIILRELAIALLFLILFLFTGQLVLQLLQISEESLTIAGGIILFLIALKMIFPRPEGIFVERIEGEPFIVPLAVPLIAGPSALATLTFIMNRDPERWPDWLLAVVLAWLASGSILLSADSLARYLGLRGIIAMERLTGMFLTALAVQMLMNGISQFFRNQLAPIL